MNVKEPILYLHQIDESILLISQYTTGITEEFFCDDRKTIDMELRCGYHYGIRTANILSFGLNRAEQKKRRSKACGQSKRRFVRKPRFIERNTR